MPLYQMAGANDYPAPTLFLQPAMRGSPPPAAGKVTYPNLVRAPGAAGVAARVAADNALAAQQELERQQLEAQMTVMDPAVAAAARRRKLLLIAGGGAAVLLVGVLLLRRG